MLVSFDRRRPIQIELAEKKKESQNYSLMLAWLISVISRFTSFPTSDDHLND